MVDGPPGKKDRELHSLPGPSATFSKLAYPSIVRYFIYSNNFRAEFPAHLPFYPGRGENYRRHAACSLPLPAEGILQQIRRTLESLRGAVGNRRICTDCPTRRDTVPGLFVVTAIEAAPQSFWRHAVLARLSGNKGRWTLVSIGSLKTEPTFDYATLGIATLWHVHFWIAGITIVDRDHVT